MAAISIYDYTTTYGLHWRDVNFTYNALKLIGSTINRFEFQVKSSVEYQDDGNIYGYTTRYDMH